jgi:hypothetical protein
VYVAPVGLWVIPLGEISNWSRRNADILRPPGGSLGRHLAADAVAILFKPAFCLGPQAVAAQRFAKMCDRALSKS